MQAKKLSANELTMNKGKNSHDPKEYKYTQEISQMVGLVRQKSTSTNPSICRCLYLAKFKIPTPTQSTW